ncbi:MAG: MBL fold metallo-hydrolase [Gammaproteobacteria bacterium]|nr:MBL fold metallo-hydrolase [Gammaproteobacteria bacterium]MDH5652484.1 MBL fold metallo-hydrolase [Gammaproteobacteria bacterium]
MSVVLFEAGDHKVHLFTDLVSGDGIQSNQFFISHGHHSALFDPGGNLTYQPLYNAIAKMTSIRELDYVVATHQDPDIISSLDKWLMYTDAQIVISKLWDRFLPHLMPGYMVEKSEGRIISIPDQGMRLPFGESEIVAVPAHFLHSVGNFHFYDPVSKILFSGDVGASLTDAEHGRPVNNFDRHVYKMQGFHERYMVANRACRLWAAMVRTMDVEMIVPQHGRPFVGRAMINQFLDWFERLQCGVDLMTRHTYSVPPARPRLVSTSAA